MRGLIVGLAVWFVTASLCAGGECLCETARWGYGPAASVSTGEDSLVLVGCGERILVIDFADPSAPAIVGGVDIAGTPVSASSGGDWAAVEVRSRETEHAVVLVDLADPSQPRHGGRITLAQPPLAMPGRLLAVGGEFVSIFDVSSLADPRLIGSYRLRGYAFSLSMVGELLAVRDRYGIELLDVTDPAAPRREATVAAGWIWAIRPGMLFSTAYGALTLTDITDAAAPVEVSRTGLPFQPTWLRLASEALLVAANHHRLVAVDISDPSAPVVGGTWERYGEIEGIAALDELALVPTGSGSLELIDLSNLAAPRHLGPLDLAPPSWAVDLVVDGDRLLAVEAEPDFALPALRVLDVSDGFSEVGTLALPGFDVARVAVDGDLAVVSTTGLCFPGGCVYDVNVVDLSDPASPLLLSSFPAEPFLDLSGDLLVTVGNSFRVVDLSDPGAPEVQAQLSDGGNAVVLVDDTAWFLRGGELCAYDLADPGSPILMGCHSEFGELSSIEAAGQVAVVAGSGPGGADGEHWIRLLDLADAAVPRELGAVPLRWPVWNQPVDYWELFWEVPPSNLAISGNLIAAGVTVGNSPHIAVIDATDPEQLRVLALDPGGASALAVHDGSVIASRRGSLSRLSGAGCTADVIHAAYSLGPERPLLGETTSFWERALGEVHEREWSFGGDATASGPSATHIFTGPEPIEVTLEVTGPAGMDRHRRVVTVGSLFTDHPLWYLVPVVAHTDGAAGTQWRSDLFIVIGGWAEEGSLFLAQRGGENAYQPGVRHVFPEGGSVLRDLMAALGGGAETAGALFVQGPFLTDSAISRTYTVTDHGTYGQAAPMVAVADLPVGPVTAVLPLLRDDAGFRMNMGLVNTTDQPTHVVVALLAADGTQLGTIEEHLDPFGVWQGNRVLRRLTGGEVHQASARVWSPDMHARIASWASVVDNRSGDAVLVLPAAAATLALPLWIPAVAHTRGANGTDWRSELEVCADGPLDARFSVELVRGQEGAAPVTLDLAAGACVRWTDVLQDLFAAEGEGALRIDAHIGDLYATSRTYTVTAAGATYGQLVPAVVQPDDRYFVLVPWLAHSTVPTEGFRSNLGIANLENDHMDLWVDLREGVGQDTYIASVPVSLEAHEHRQLNDVLAPYVSGDVEHAWATVRTVFGQDPRRFLAYSSVIDNRTGDPVFVMGEE